MGENDAENFSALCGLDPNIGVISDGTYIDGKLQFSFHLASLRCATRGQSVLLA